MQGSKSKFALAWQGMELLLKKVERCLDGTPAKGPVAAINALIDLKNAVGDNDDALRDTIDQVAKRLTAIDKSIDNGVPDTALARMKTFAETLQKEINELKEMSLKGLLIKLLESEVYNGAIAKCFKRIDEATKTLLLDIAWSTERKVYEIDSDIKKMLLQWLLRGRKAIYNTDLGGGLTREPCTEGTRMKIREDIIGWAMDSSPDSPSVFWLSGQAGSGKTTIAYTIAQHFDKLDRAKNSSPHTVLGGSFLCSRQFEETRERIRILPTLVYQLAQKSRSYAHALHKADRFDSYDKLSEQMEDLLSGPWQESEAERYDLPSYLIVIDALDEIESQEGSAFLEDLLKAIDACYLQGLKFFVTSRPDPNVARLCESLSPKVVRRLQDVPREDVKSDIAVYLQAKLPKLGRPDLDKVATQADGLFIFAATVVRYLTPHHSITQREQSMLLENLFSQKSVAGAQLLLIDELYQNILCQAFSGLPEDLRHTRLHILHTFLCTIERTSTSVAAALLSEPDDEIVDAVLRDLHAVLYIKDGQVLWYHSSFPDFIFTSTRSKFKADGHEMDMSCNAADQHALLTKACFDIMLSDNLGLRFNIGHISSSFILDDEDKELAARVNTNISDILKYASHYWASHLVQSQRMTVNRDDPSCYISNFCGAHVLFWIEAMHLLGSSGQCSVMLQHTRGWILKNAHEQAELAANINEAANFATYFVASPAALLTPHLYMSALATWSKDSGLSQQWKKQLTHIPFFTHLKARDVPLMIIKATSLLTSVAFSSDGTCIISGSWDNSVRIWDASSGDELKVLNGHTKVVTSVAFSSDSTHIVSGSWDKSLRVWDATSGAELKVLNGHTNYITSIALSANGTHIASGSWDKSVRVWNALSGDEMKVLNGHTESITSVTFSIDGNCIVSGSWDNSVRVWDSASGTVLRVLNGHTDSVYSVALSNDGSHIVSGSEDMSVRVWNALSGAELKMLNGHTKGVHSVKFSSNSTHIVSGSLDESVRMWDILSGAELKILNGHTNIVNSVNFSNDGTRIISCSWDESVRVWDATIEDDLKVLNGHVEDVNSVAFSSDDTCIISGSNDKSVRIWNASNGAQLKTLNGHTDIVTSIALSTDGTHIVSGSWDKSVRVWDASSGAELKVLNGHTQRVTSVAFSSDGTCIVSASEDFTLRMWDASSGVELKVFNGHTDDDKSVRVWDASSGAELKVLNGHTNFVTSVAFSKNTCIVSGSWDLSVRVWDAWSGAELKVLNGHVHHVTSVAFSSDGTRIVSGSKDSSVRVWDALSGAELQVLNGHIHFVNSVAFSNDGTRIVSGSRDESVQVSIAEPLSPPWTRTQDNWIVSLPERDRLMWVAHDGPVPLFLPYTLLIISRHGFVSINFQDCKIGQDWAGCYISG
ncbi:hypothetical protein M413DRAFT_72500 [Hebeloma cylindrosporum]|uniref:NACHT domain-containing protein n=1 Tax=Hebeloma cylindrosporum TaxID=76867 RepID=A0A0C3C9G1_HEBCY|nr:hypothetical protein M413DRAFT_72500 [Hebeloma cylindrosporum h7]